MIGVGSNILTPIIIPFSMNVLDKTNFKLKIFSGLDQVELFSKYTGISVMEINECLRNSNRKTNNLLRTDRHASTGFRWSYDKETKTNKIKMYDFADSYWRGDIIDIAGKVLQRNANRGKDFIEICEHIIEVGEKDLHNIHEVKVITKEENHALNLLRFQSRSFSRRDLDYWGKQGLSEIDLQLAKIVAVDYIWNMNNELTYVYRVKDVCYAYILDKIKNTNIIKYYFINRGRHGDKRARFITNNIYPLEAMHELVPADVLIITKSRGDAVVLKKLLDNINQHSLFSTGELTICVTNLTSETVRLNNTLGNYFTHTYKYIYINVDFDREGIRCAKYHLKKFGFQPIFLTNGKCGTHDYKAKDIRDYVIKFGVTKAEELLLETMENIVNDLLLIDNRKLDA